MTDESKAKRQTGVRLGLALLVLAVSAAAIAINVRAETPASPPCNGEVPQPPYASVGAAPNVQIWKQQNLSDFSARAACLGWPTPNFQLLIAVAGTFQASDGAAGVLSRFGEVSKTLGVRYWSTTEHTWRPLVLAATALTGKVDGQPREDFTPAELESGRHVYFSQTDSRGAREVIYRMRVREINPDRLVIETENVTSVRWLALTLLKPGGLHSVYFVERRSAGIWSFYSLTRIVDGSWFISGHANSYINRVVALYRYIARIPTDLEPPYAP